jgi:transcriptional regulator with PAS, ATPase and Fis domain
VGEIPLELQAKLLRVIQEREFERVGGDRLIETDFRLIAATNRDLQQEVKAGNFREDLYYRINVVEIHLPPLREREEDIPRLIDYFIKKHCGKTGKALLEISQEARDAFTDYEWPGNIRELENIIERAVIITEGPKIEKRDIAFFPGALRNESELFYDRKRSLEKMKILWEGQIISKAIHDNNGNVKGAAEQLKIGLTTLYDKIKEYKNQN